MYKSRLKIGGQERTVVVFNYKEEDKDLAVSKSVGQKHHIHVYDRSGSMSNSLDDLIDNMKETIRYIPEGDYVSIIWFSGEGQYKVLIKGAQKNEDIFKLLDSTRSTIGCTCFSEALQEVGQIINDLKIVCPNFIVNVFTDGRPVVSWGEAEEEKRIYREIAKWQEEVIALNTIGYGPYYNQELLRNMAAMSMYGVMVHSKYIREYFDIFKDNVERVQDLVKCGVNVTAALVAEIMYFGGKSTKLGRETMSLGMLDKKKNQFVLVSPDDDFEFEINGEKYNSRDIKAEVPATTLTPVLYAYAYEQYYKGNRQYTLDIMGKTLKDKYLVDEQVKAFTFDECSEFSKKLKSAVYSGKARQVSGECADNYIPADDAVCVMDVLKVMVAGDCYYQYASEYKRIGLQQVDGFNRFVKDDKEFYTPLNELVFNENRLNISLRSKITGRVELNPIRAEKVGLPKVIDSHIYRTQTLIRDGELNMQTITVVVDGVAYQTLKAMDTFGFITDAQEDKSGYMKLVLALDKIPIINRTYLTAVGKTSNILRTTHEIATLACNQKVINAFIKKLNAKYPTYGRDVTTEQLEVLAEHGLGRDMGYNGIDVKPAEKTDGDFYEARELTFGIAGMMSDPPSLNEVLKKLKEGKKISGQAAIMADYISELQNELNRKALPASTGAQFSKRLAEERTPAVDLTTEEGYDFAGAMDFFETKLREIKLALLRCRIEMSSAKIAKTLTGDWFDGVADNGKGGYNYTEGDTTLVINTKKVKCYF